MRKLNLVLITIFLSMIFIKNHAQNLVPNNSFEVHDTCPQYSSKLYYASPWFQPHICYGNTTNSCSSELFDSCNLSGEVDVPLSSFGNQWAKSGSAYSGIFCHVDTINKREYLEIPLNSPLIADSLYCVKFYISLAELSKKAISSIGAYFSVDSLLDPSFGGTIEYVTPQVQNNSSIFLTSKTAWMLVSGYFVANGGEKYMTIGNFLSAANTSVQNVSGGSIDWVYYFIDDISVEICATGTGSIENSNKSIFKIFPNPANDKVTFEFDLKNASSAILEIRDVTCKIIKEYALDENVNSLVLENDFQNGIYFCNIIADGSLLKSEKLVIIK
jgi:hypothetical protein